MTYLHYNNLNDCNLEIINYSDIYSKQFRELNEEWLNEYSLMEELDWRMINDPEKYIIDIGGKIFLAKCGEQIVGTCGLIKESNDTCQIIKLAVTKGYQGKKIGKTLCRTAISAAMNDGARKVYILSNSLLIRALNLYKKLGFKEVEIGDAEKKYVTIDVKMVLELN